MRLSSKDGTRLSVEFNLNNSTASVWIEWRGSAGQVGLNIETTAVTAKSPGIVNFRVYGQPGSVVWVDDIEVRILDGESASGDGGSGNRLWQKLFGEDFDDYENIDELIYSGGWIAGNRIRPISGNTVSRSV